MPVGTAGDEVGDEVNQGQSPGQTMAFSSARLTLLLPLKKDEAPRI